MDTPDANGPAVDYPLTPKSARRRSSRRSWFDTPPVTPRDIAVQKQQQLPPRKAAVGQNKRRSLDEVETLVLSHFTKPPRVGFGKIIMGRSKTRVLLIQNPADYDQEVVLERFPYKKGFNVNQTHFVVAPEEVVTLTLTWTPQDAGGCREMVLFHINDVYRLQAYMFGTADDPKPVKKGRKGMLGTRNTRKQQQPSSVVQTESLKSIRDNYSPRRSEELRDLRSHIRPPPGGPLHGVDQENVSPGDLDDPAASHTPPPLESTAICRGDERLERRKSGFDSPTLSKMSPIPLMAGNNNGCTMESYLSTTTSTNTYHPSPQGAKDAAGRRSPLKHVTKNGGNAAHDSCNTHRGERSRDKLETHRSEKMVKNGSSSTLPKNGSSSALPKNGSSSSTSTLPKNGSMEAENPVVGVESKVHVSPSSFLNDSLAGRTMATTAAEVGRVCASYQMVRVAGREKKVTVSPNSFVQNMGSQQPPPRPLVHDPHTHAADNPSPSTVLNGSIPHDVMMKQLRHVRRSLHGGSFHESPFAAIQNKAVSKPQPPPSQAAGERINQLAHPKGRNVFAHSQRPNIPASKKDKFLQRKLQDRARFAKITDAPSPRRKTFLITKKQPGRRGSPQKTRNTQAGTTGVAPSRGLASTKYASVKKPTDTENARTDDVGRVDSRTVQKASREGEVLFKASSNEGASIPGQCKESELTQDDAATNRRRSMWDSPAVTGFLSPVIAVQSDCDSTGDERRVSDSLQLRERTGEGCKSSLATVEQVALTTETGEIPASQETDEKGRQSSGRRLFPDVVGEDLNLSKDFRPLWSGSATVTKDRPSISPLPSSGSTDSSKKLFPDIDPASATTPGVTPESTPVGDRRETEAAGRARVRKDDVDSPQAAEHSSGEKQAQVEIVDMGVANSCQSRNWREQASRSESGVEIVDMASADSQQPRGKLGMTGRLLDDGRKAQTRSLSKIAHLHAQQSSSFEWLSPQQLPQSPVTEAHRRSTLTVTKSRPSQALLDACKNETAENIASQLQEMTPEVKQNDSDELWQSETIVIETRNNAVVSMMVHREVLTPGELPTSPMSENSRRSTHSVRNPVVLSRDGMVPKNLFGSGPESRAVSACAAEANSGKPASQSWGVGPKEEDDACEENRENDEEKDNEAKNKSMSRHSTTPSVKKTSSPAVYTDRTEQHVGVQRDCMLRPIQSCVPYPVLDSSVSSQELSTDSLETEKQSSRHRQVSKDSMNDNQHARNTSTCLSNEKETCITKEVCKELPSQEDVTESLTEITLFHSVESKGSLVVETSGHRSAEHSAAPANTAARETSAKPAVTGSVVKEALLKKEETATKTVRSSSSSSSSMASDRGKGPSSRHAWLVRSSSADLPSLMPPPQPAKSPAARSLRQTAASHHKAKDEAIPRQGLPKTRLQGSLDRRSAASQGNLETRSQESLDQCKTRSHGKLEHSKTRSQESLDQCKTRSQESLDRSKTGSQANHLSVSGVTEQHMTRRVEQQTERRVSRKRTSPEAGLKHPHSKRVELDRCRVDRGRGQQTCAQGSSTSRPKVGKSGKAARGLPLSRLILVKKSKTALPRHPLPFAAKNMYYDERWQDKQERGFVHWLNFVLTPADEYVLATTKTKVDARTIAFDGPCQQVAPRLAPTKEVLSFRAYAARRRLNNLRRASCRLFQSEGVVRVVCRVELEVEQRRLAVRRDRMIHADIGLKQKILDLLLSYNPLWLRIGLETVYGEVLPVHTNSDVIGMSRFVLTRLLTSPDISAHYAHPTVPHLYHDGYADAVAQHMLKKFLVLVYFLDRAKESRLIAHDPCLFCKDADIKSTKGLLIQFSRDFLSGEGDVTKHLAYMGYVVSHVQTPLDEFDYAVANLCTDLRDGLRLGRIVMLLSGDWSFAPSLRSPAISRLQKIHNVELVFRQLTQRGLDLNTAKGAVLTVMNPRDIVDGHREKTLAFLWKLIFHFQAMATLNEQELQEEVAMLERTLRVKVCMQKMLGHPHDSLSTARRDSGGPSATMDGPLLQLLLKWCRTVCLHYGVKVENFTVSFSDGRALCCLLHHYHPALLPLSRVQFRTSQSLQDAAAENAEQDRNAGEEEDDDDLSHDWGAAYHLGGDLDQSLFESLLSNEKENFRILYEKVSELGGIPLMLKAADMTNTIPDERVVVTYVSYLCARLLDLREETRAARLIQWAWRRFCLRRSALLRQKQTAASVVIQRAWRQYRVAMTTRQQEAAALCLQTMWRRRQALRTAALLRLAREDSAMHEAAGKIQTCVRHFLTRQRLQRQIDSAVVIQSHVRAHRARKAFLQHKQACLTIQTRLRAHTQGAIARCHFQAQKRSAIVVQRAFRQRRTRRLESLNRAANVVQSFWRGRKCRGEFLRGKRAAVYIQAWWRATQAQRHLALMSKACTTIQRQFRASRSGSKVREEYLQLRWATLTLQKHVRGHQQCRRYSQLKNSALTVQKNFRRYRYRVKFQALRLATIIIQRAVRAHQARMAARQLEVRKNQAAVKIQAAVRGFIARRQTRLLRQEVRREQVCITIQCAYRRHRATQAVGVLRAAARRERAARMIQSAYRCYAARRLLQQARREQAVVRIQSAYRRHCAIQHFKALQLEARKVAAAVLLQAAVRRFFAVKKVDALRLAVKRERAVVRIQCAYRRFVAGKALRELQLEAKRQISARKIQMAYRCYLAVRQLRALQLQARQRAAAIRIQCLHRRHSAKKRLRALQKEARRQSAAAVAIQSAYRRFLAVRELRALQLSARREANALKIQSVFRGHLARRYAHALKEAAWRESASWKIQTLVRGYQQLRRYATMRQAAVSLQAHTRGYLARKKHAETKELLLILGEYEETEAKFQGVIREFHQRWSAALTLQAAWRGRQQRRTFLKTKSSVCALQAAVRGWAERKRCLLLNASATVIQRRFRAHRLGQAARLRYQLMLGAAVVIQSWWKMFVIRSFYRQLRARVIVAQAQCRGFLARTRFRQQRQAAVCLQRQFRAWAWGREARKGYLKTRHILTNMQARVRAKQQQERFRTQRQSCVRIQAAARAWLARRRYQNQRQSAVKLQRRWRACLEGRRDRERFTQARTALVTIQSFTRGHLARRHVRSLQQAACVVQSHFRGHHARREFLRLRQAAVTVQRHVRLFLQARRQSRHLAVVNQACVRIQAAYRGRRARHTYLQYRRSVVTLQALVRARRQSRRYLALYTATLACQTRYRAKCLGRVFRTAFLLIRQAVIVIQTHVRGYRARRVLRVQKSSVILMQARVRGWLQRGRWLQQKGAAACLQQRWRARSMGRVTRLNFTQTRRAAVTLQRAWRTQQQACLINAHRAATVIQKHFRRLLTQNRFRSDRQRIVRTQAAVRGFLARREASKRLYAVNVMQKRWRETLKARQCRSSFVRLVRAAVVIQSAFRGYRSRVRFAEDVKRIVWLQAAVRGSLQRRKYLRLRHTALTLQRGVRNNTVCRYERSSFLQQRRSAVRIQRTFRSWQRARRERDAQAATCLQSYVRMLPVHRRFLRTKFAVIVLQSAFRAHQARRAFRQKKTAILLIQRRVRFHLLVQRLRLEVHRHQQGALTIQRAVRNYLGVLRSEQCRAAVRVQAAVRGYVQRRRFLTKKRAALTLQSGVRGWRDRRRARELRGKVKAAVTIQRGFRAWKERKEEKVRGQQRQKYLQRYAGVARRHLAVVRIQRWYRQAVLMRQAGEQLHSVIVLQRRVRAFLQRCWFLRVRQEAEELRERRDKAARVIQSAVREWRVQLEERRRLRLITKVQAIWRGRQVRGGLKSRKLATARRRLQEATQRATEEKTLGHRTASALDFLLHYKQLAYILDALMHLDVATRLSWVCCERLVEVNAVGVIYRLILSCNRSLPHMELIKFSVSVLLNLAKYEKTTQAVYEAEDSLSTLVDLLSIYREKGGAIFTKTCMLLAILGTNAQRKAEMRADRQLVAKLQSIHALVLRKHRMQVARARVAARASLNATLPSRLHGPLAHRVRPAWVLRRDSVHDIEDPTAALSFLLDTLHIGPK